jgi:hypothetical protein
MQHKFTIKDIEPGLKVRIGDECLIFLPDEGQWALYDAFGVVVSEWLRSPYWVVILNSFGYQLGWDDPADEVSI